MMKKILSTLSIILSASLTMNAFADHTEVKSLEGVYTCVGVDNSSELGARIDGAFSLKKVGQAYQLTQLDAKTNKPIKNEYNEVAIQQGPALAIAYQDVKYPKVFGVEIMTLSKKNPRQLKGQFIFWNNFDRKSEEVCTRR